MGRRVLATDVHVWRDDKSAFFTLPADTEVPEWAQDLVTNPKAFKVVVTDDTPADDEVPATYAEMKNAQLKDLLKARELPTSGNHDELVSRLLEDDAERDADGEDDEPSGDDTPADDEE